MGDPTLDRQIEALAAKVLEHEDKNPGYKFVGTSISENGKITLKFEHIDPPKVRPIQLELFRRNYETSNR